MKHNITTFPGAMHPSVVGLDKRARAVQCKQGQLKSELSFEDVYKVCRESAWSPIEFTNNTRTGDNFKACSILALDVDDGLDVEGAAKTLENCGYNFAIALSMNHQKDGKDRFRILLELEKPIKNADVYLTTWKAAMNLFPQIDKSCKDKARFYFESPGFFRIKSDGSKFPVTKPSKPAAPRKRKSAASSKFTKFMMVPAILEYMMKAPDCGDGEFHEYRWKCAKEFGKQMVPLSQVEHFMAAFSPMGELDADDKENIIKNWEYGSEESWDMKKKTGLKNTHLPELMEEEYPGKFKVYEDETGNRSLILEIDGNQAKVVDGKVLTTKLARAIAKYYKDSPGHKMVRDMVNTWSDLTDQVIYEEPKMVTFKDDNSLSYQQLDFNLADMPTPKFDDFTNRIKDGNKDAFLAYMWSIFDLNSDRRQYMWVYGDGTDGKSSILSKFFVELLGNAGTNLTDPKPDSKTNAMFLGKRLVVFSDTNTTTLVTTAWFKNATGEDSVQCKLNYIDEFMAPINSKFVLLSNNYPKINNKSCDLDRIIMIEIEPIDKSTFIRDRNYVEKLHKEAPGILYKCREAYKKIVGEDGFIPYNDIKSKELAMCSDDGYLYIFDRFFTEGNVEKDKLENKDITPIITQMCKSMNIKIGEWKIWLSKQKFVTIRRAKGREQFWGIKRK